jgi:ABC-2 type transport system ATP-binding protein
MRIVLGVLEPDAGEVRWQGRPCDAGARARFGYMPEERGLYPKMRVADQLVHFARLHGLDHAAARAAAARWLERLGLEAVAGRRTETLSLGNQQRAQLAAALVHDPELLVLDEPFSGLDPIGIATMTDVVHERARAGVGVIFSSHQLDLVEDVCEDVVIIARGRIVAAGPIDELKASSGRRHLDIEVAGTDGAWIGNLPDVQVLEHSGGRMRLLVNDRVPLDELLAAARSAGELRQFSYQPPRLSELFMEAVAEPANETAAPAEVAR